ncbi:hypothetical protein PS900_03750 [Pseudomonas fluorescens]|uniref:LysR substrate-binding domain-containing protein n=2 Tax=Pseudomonas fluorescens TaxID=294 RepID=A0A8H2NU48_PSEFL|nr:hypothetical protein PS900_03750 [Pseudomonas fluorescens]
MEVSSYDAPCLMVQAGLGIGITPEGSAAIYRMDGAKAVRLDESWACRELSVCVRSREALSVAAGLFLEHLLEREEAISVSMAEALHLIRCAPDAAGVSDQMRKCALM